MCVFVRLREREGGEVEGVRGESDARHGRERETQREREVVSLALALALTLSVSLSLSVMTLTHIVITHTSHTHTIVTHTVITHIVITHIVTTHTSLTHTFVTHVINTHTVSLTHAAVSLSAAEQRVHVFRVARHFAQLAVHAAPQHIALTQRPLLCVLRVVCEVCGVCCVSALCGGVCERERRWRRRCETHYRGGGGERDIV